MDGLPLQERKIIMSNPNAAAAASTPMKTPSYAWPCLIVSLLCAVTLVWAWQWLPGITFPVFKEYLASTNPQFQNPAMFGQMANTMGLVPIGAIIMALPTTFLVQKIGPKWATVIGMGLGILGTLICALTVESDFTIFLVGRFIFGLALACTIVAGPTCVSIWFPGSTRGRAMAIWSCWAPIGIFTVNLFGGNVLGVCGGSVSVLQWVWVVCMVIAAVLMAVVFRDPKGDEVSEVAPDRKRLRDVLPFFKSRQLWCLIFMFAVFNYMNYAFSQYLKTWLATPLEAGGLGWDPMMSGLIGGALCACGILAPIGGWILDKLPREKKYIAVVIGICSLTVCSFLAFLNNMPIFCFYALFFCIGNMFLNGCCRPMVPSFVFAGGATAVSFGLSFLTLGQYLGQIPTSYAFAAGEAVGWTYNEIMLYCFVPVGVIGIILSLFMKPSKPKAVEGGKPEAKPAE
ncbi:MAG: MFS transporter [Eggerthellaceae bacterium]|nr:MFS transporter [Eggerthellaceae bacterium]